MGAVSSFVIIPARILITLTTLKKGASFAFLRAYKKGAEHAFVFFRDWGNRSAPLLGGSRRKWDIGRLIKEAGQVDRLIPKKGGQRLPRLTHKKNLRTRQM